MVQIAGVRAYARCVHCGTVMWTTNGNDPADQACVCKCGATEVVNETVIGDADPTFQPQTLQDLIDAESS